MKILQIINSFETGGAEKLLLDNIPVYNEHGIQMDLLLINGKETPFLNDLIERKVCSTTFLGKNNLYNPRNIFKLIKYFKNYDIVHAHLFPTLYLVAIAKLISFSRVKLIYTEHNTMNRRRRIYFFKLIDRLIYSVYDCVICISEEVQIKLFEHIKHLKMSLIIGNGVDISKIIEQSSYPKSYFNLIDTHKVIIQVSRFFPQKDQFTLIKSMTLLPSNVYLILVGDGPMKDEAVSLADGLGVLNRIFFLGLRSDAIALMKSSDIVVLSSHYEGLSLSSIEGLASGKPFVASDVPGLTKIVDGAGILFEESNFVELSKIISLLLNDENLYRQVANKCMERAIDYDAENMINKHIEIYNQLVTKK
jgi:glycosyltransferase involved in cell wall biosynthesis